MVEEALTRPGLLEEHDSGDRGEHPADHEDCVRAQEVRQVEDHLGDGRQVGVERLEDGLEGRNDAHHQEHRDADHEDHRDDRVGHRRLDLAAELLRRLHVVGETVQDDVHLTGDLARLHHADVERRERARALFHGRGEVRATADRVHEHLARLLHPLGLGLVPEHVQALEEGEPRPHHRGELAREDDDLALLRAAAARRCLAGGVCAPFFQNGLLRPLPSSRRRMMRFFLRSSATASALVSAWMVPSTVEPPGPFAAYLNSATG